MAPGVTWCYTIHTLIVVTDNTASGTPIGIMSGLSNYDSELSSIRVYVCVCVRALVCVRARARVCIYFCVYVRVRTHNNFEMLASQHQG